MRALQVPIMLAAVLAIVGVAAAQNNPCPECDPDGDGVYDNPYHSVDVGVIDEDGITESGLDEVLADTDVAYANEGDDKGFWLWLAICLSAFLSSVEDTLGIHTDIDANVEVYLESDGVDIDASVVGTQPICDAVGVEEDCEFNFDESDLGDLDGTTWELIADVEATLGSDVEIPAVVPHTETIDVDLCLEVDIALCEG